MPMRVFVGAFLLCLVLFTTTGCGASSLGEIRNAGLSPDGKLFAVVHRHYTKLILTISDLERKDTIQFEVSSPSLCFLNELLVVERVLSGVRRVVAYKIGEFKEPLFCSASISFNPCVVSGRIYYTALVNGFRQIHSVSPSDWRESPYTDDGRDYPAFVVLPEGDAILAVSRQTQDSQSFMSRHLTGLKFLPDRHSVYSVGLETPDRLAESPIKVDIEYFDVGGGTALILQNALLPVGGSLLVDKELNHIAIGDSDKYAFFSISLSRFRKPKASSKPVNLPQIEISSILPRSSGFFLSSKTGIYSWDCRKDPVRDCGAYPFEIGRIFDRSDFGYIASLATTGLPARHLALIEPDAYKLMPLQKTHASEIAEFLESKRMYSQAAIVRSQELPESTPSFSHQESTHFAPLLGLLDSAEVEFAEGNPEAAIEIYAKHGSQYAMRIGEIYLSSLSNRDAALIWFSKISDKRLRLRVDMFLDILTDPSDKFRTSYYDAHSARCRGDYATARKLGAQYLKKMDERTFDPDLIRFLIERASYEGDTQAVKGFIELCSKVGMKSRFKIETAELISDHLFESKRSEEAISSLLNLCSLEPEKSYDYANRAIAICLESGKGAKEALQATDILLKYKLEPEEVLRIRVQRMVIGSLFARDQRTVLEESSYLAWGAFDNSLFAAQAGTLSVLMCDNFSMADGNAVLERFVRNPRVSVQSAVPVVADVAFRSAVMRLPQKCYELGVPELPDWFRIRCRILRSLTELSEGLPKNALMLLSEGACDPESLAAEFANKEYSELGERIRSIASIIASATPPLDQTVSKAAPVQVGLLFFGTPQLNWLPVRMFDFENSTELPFLRALIAHRNCDPRLVENIVLNDIICGNAVSHAFFSSYADDILPQQDELQAFCSIISSADWPSLSCALSKYPQSAWTEPLWSLFASVGIEKGESRTVADKAEMGIKSSHDGVWAAAHDAACMALFELGDKQKLKKYAEQLALVKGYAGSFAKSRQFAELMAETSEEKGDEEQRKHWLAEVFSRGGFISMPDAELAAWLEKNKGVFELFAKNDATAAAYFIFMRADGMRGVLLEACGEEREKVEKELEYWLPVENDEDDAVDTEHQQPDLNK